MPPSDFSQNLDDALTLLRMLSHRDDIASHQHPGYLKPDFPNPGYALLRLYGNTGMAIENYGSALVDLNNMYKPLIKISILKSILSHLQTRKLFQELDEVQLNTIIDSVSVAEISAGEQLIFYGSRYNSPGHTDVLGLAEATKALASVVHYGISCLGNTVKYLIDLPFYKRQRESEVRSLEIDTALKEIALVKEMAMLVEQQTPAIRDMLSPKISEQLAKVEQASLSLIAKNVFAATTIFMTPPTDRPIE